MPISNSLSIPNSFIKNIAIEIKEGYKLTNTPFTTEENSGADDAYFIGRKIHKEKFLKFLNDSDKGIFLVTGERGIGKTSFVNHVLKEYKDNSEKAEKNKTGKIKTIHLTLSQNKPKEIDILWLMVTTVHDKFKIFLGEGWLRNSTKIIRAFKQAFKISLFFSVFCCAFLLLIIWRADQKWSVLYNSAQKWLTGELTAQSNNIYFNNWSELFTYKLLFGSSAMFFISLVLFLLTKVKEVNQKKKNTPQNRIERLKERCNALLTEESGGEDEVSIQGISGLFGQKEKVTKNYSIASVKEIEYELQEFLKQAEKKFDLKFIFIFDELDKVDPVVTSAYFYEDLDKFQKTENSNPRDFRDRKQAIINTIAALKNFFTTARARFIFIAGNEMFDAALADIADRQASVSSIFTYTFHIESFLKEKNVGKRENNASLSVAIEEYLKWVLFRVKEKEEDILLLIKTKLRPRSEEKDRDVELAKAIITLQNFITYLTYRANGSPKKIIKIIHEFIIVKESRDPWASTNDGKTIFLDREAGNKEDKISTRLFLYFNYSNQYRIGFISYLYRPFLIQYGRNFKLFSDNIIISTPYLFDHLLKFHPFAFSLSHLELVPEVVSSNKTPSLQEHLRNIIDYLGENHIRRTDLGLFDYKFYSRTLNEITYISKLFEEEAAAFNFTLDESYLVKIYIRGKIKELRSIYSKFLGDAKEGGAKQIFSIAHLNGRLGDLHFFDQEYDDAIVAYSDAIRPINNLEIAGMSLREFITLFRNKLKLGLCFERTSSYDEALAFYADCCQDAKRFMMFRLGSKKIKDREPFQDNMIYETSSLSELLQVVIQGFLATIIVEEKIGMEGITPKKLNLSLANFLHLADQVIEKTDGTEKNSPVFGNAFLLMGKLFYFKNASGNIVKENMPEGGKMAIIFNNFPRRWKSRFEYLSNNYINDFTSLAENAFSRKIPTIALYMYLIGICEIIESQEKEATFFNEISQQENKIRFHKSLLAKLEELLVSDDQNFLSYHYKYIANFLSSIGDTLLSMCYEGDKYRTLQIHELFDFKAADGTNKNDYKFCQAINTAGGNKIGEILNCYYLSGIFFLKYGRSVSCSYQFRKILYVLKTVIANDNSDPDKRNAVRDKFISLIEETIITPTLEIASQNAGHSDRHMIKKMRKIFKEENESGEKSGLSNSLFSFILNSVSNNPETREIIIVYNYIQLKLGITDKLKKIISSCNSLGTQYSRLVELEFCAKYNYVTIFKKLIEEDIKPVNISEEKNRPAAIEYLFSMLSMLRIQKIYGSDFLIGHSSFAYTHYRIAKFLKNFKVDKEIRSGVENLVGKGSYVSFDAVYHFQMARDLYKKVKQLHTAGKEYKKVISEMIYLEDDFSDNAYHFGAAINRYLMINRDFDEKIKYCEEQISKDEYYDSSNYNNI